MEMEKEFQHKCKVMVSRNFTGGWVLFATIYVLGVEYFNVSMRFYLNYAIYR